MSTYYRSIIRIVFLLGIFILPFVWWPTAPIPYEIPRVIFLQRWIELLALLTIGGFWCWPEIKFDKKLVQLGIGFLIIVGLSAVLGANPTKSLVGNYWRGDGIVTLGHLVGLAVIVGIWWDRTLERNAVRLMGLSVIIVGGWAGWVWANQNFAATGVSFGQPVFMAGWLLVCGIIVVNYKLRIWEKIVVLLGMLLGIVATQTWAVLLIFGIYLWWGLPKLRILVLVGVVVLFGWWAVKKQNVSWLGPSGVVYEGRERIFRKVFTGWTQRPVLGWGFANVDLAFQSNDWPFPIANDVYVDKAHSTMLEVLATTGIFGLIAYLLVLGRLGWKFRRTVWFLPLIFFVLHAQTNIVGIGEETLFWLLVGIGLNKG